MSHLISSGIDSSYSGPWHEGERAAQLREGVRGQMEEVGLRVLRNYMPEQHRNFFTQLPFLIAGSVDASGQPWASVLAQRPGFITSPDPQHLAVRAAPLAGDPLADTLRPGAALGLLGIEPHTRRRNRMNGIVEHVVEDGFTVRVTQSFGNCPKYISARKPEYAGEHPDHAGTVHRAATLDEAALRMIRNADTFFIATSHPGAYATDLIASGDDALGNRSHGADVSHRGGKPGFVHATEEGLLTVPDFVGNQFFNTIGNLAVNPRAGMLFIDFANGDLLYLAVGGETIWEGPEVAAFAGAQRLLRFQVKQVQRTEAILPLRWGAAAPSPFVAPTGSWAA
jgi:predicted pyridoxine 5'-phosphate oxidase superfamily flavin-nucleotide-binding protein